MQSTLCKGQSFQFYVLLKRYCTNVYFRFVRMISGHVVLHMTINHAYGHHIRFHTGLIRSSGYQTGNFQFISLVLKLCTLFKLNSIY